MFSFIGKESCSVQFYGKLPLAKDYLRVGAGSGAGQTLRDWFDRAFSQGANAKDPMVLPWPAALIVGESWGQTLCAAAWPSGDAGNLRPFPFTAFIERKKKALLEDLAHGFPVSSPVFDWLSDVYAAREAHSDGQSFIAAMRKHQIAIDGIKPFDAERIDFDNWVSALWPDNGKDGLLECLRGLEALRRATHRGPIRLPLVANLPIRAQVSAWFRLLVDMNLIGRESLPTLFFPLPARGPAQPEPPKEEVPSESESSSDSSDSSYSSEPEPEPEPEPSESSSESSDASASEGSGETPPSDAPGDHAYLVIFRATPPPAEAIWLRPPDPRTPRRPGDFCTQNIAAASSTEPASEGVPPLSDSLHGAFAGVRGRLAR
jgi:hypothetical protein